MKKAWGEHPDKLHNRRNLAFWSVIFSLIIWPHELIILHYHYHLEVAFCEALLTYVCTIAGTSIGGYLWAAHTQDRYPAMNQPMCPAPPPDLQGE